MTLSSLSSPFKKHHFLTHMQAETLMHKREDLRYASEFEQAVQLSLQVFISIFSLPESAGLPFLGQYLVAGVRPCAVSLAKLVGYQSYSKIPILSVELLSCLTKTQVIEFSLLFCILVNVTSVRIGKVVLCTPIQGRASFGCSEAIG